MDLKSTFRQAALTIGAVALFSNAFSQPCVDGFAGDYPCELVDQLSFLDLADLNADNVNDVWGWTSPYSHREYALIGFDNKMVFIDQTSPEYPIFLGYLPTATVASLWRDVKVVGHHCYIVAEAGMHGMQVFDLRRLEDLQAAETPFVFDADNHYQSFGHCHNIVADTANHFVYAVGTSTVGGGLHVIDVQDPQNLVHVGSNSLAGYVHDAQVLTYNGPDTEHVGKQICLGFNEDYLAIYDVTDKTDIEILSLTPYEDVGYVHQGWLTTDQRYMMSNDEHDELNLGYGTRTIVWDLLDLDEPEVINYFESGNESIDHNLYVHNEMVYQSNYTSGLRIFDVLDIADGHLEPFGNFDVIPEHDNTWYTGNWSTYPYFESGVIPTSNMYVGVHFLKPRFFELSNDELLVCNADEMTMEIKINKRIFGTVSYAVEMEDVQGLIPELEMTETEGAPATNSVQWYGLAGLDPGYYPGEVVITYDLGEERIPFVLVREEGDPLTTTQLVSPENEEVLPEQWVDFEIADTHSGYGTLQVALDAEFGDIVYEETFYNVENTFSAFMPFQFTSYFWRWVKPTACGEDIVSPTGMFSIDVAASVTDEFAYAETANLYPNPAANQLSVKSELINQEQIRVFDLTGRLVDTWQVNGQTTNATFDVSSLTKGVYLLKSSESNFTGKFVKE